MWIDKNIWISFWIKLQEDIADTLQNNILNFSTLVAIISLYVKIFFPEHSTDVDNFMMSYLLVSGKTKN